MFDEFHSKSHLRSNNNKKHSTKQCKSLVEKPKTADKIQPKTKSKKQQI